MPEIKAPPVYRVVLDRWFDISNANTYEHYYLQESRMVGIFRKHREWVPVKVSRQGLIGESYKVDASGNAEWAKRIMKEYGIRGVVILP